MTAARPCEYRKSDPAVAAAGDRVEDGRIEDPLASPSNSSRSSCRIIESETSKAVIRLASVRTRASAANSGVAGQASSTARANGRPSKCSTTCPIRRSLRSALPLDQLRSPADLLMRRVGDPAHRGPLDRPAIPSRRDPELGADTTKPLGWVNRSCHTGTRSQQQQRLQQPLRRSPGRVRPCASGWEPAAGPRAFRRPDPIIWPQSGSSVMVHGSGTRGPIAAVWARGPRVCPPGRRRGAPLRLPRKRVGCRRAGTQP